MLDIYDTLTILWIFPRAESPLWSILSSLYRACLRDHSLLHVILICASGDYHMVPVYPKLPGPLLQVGSLGPLALPHIFKIQVFPIMPSCLKNDCHVGDTHVKKLIARERYSLANKDKVFTHLICYYINIFVNVTIHKSCFQDRTGIS